MDINKKIEELRFKKGWSIYELAQESGITQSTIASMINRGTPPKVETLRCICDAFGITLSQFFAEDEDVEYLTASERELLSAFRNMNDDKKAALLKFISK